MTLFVMNLDQNERASILVAKLPHVTHADDRKFNQRKSVLTI